ncbi:MAG TPA: hypothetical protein VM327_08390 [Candidatus Thermoplasmatota archaeon]|nr:hypothetical protein [Candidatus Thermoplasmatota archaeon]
MPLRPSPGLTSLALAILAVAVLAGCASPAAAPPAEPVPANVPTSLAATGPAVGPDLGATTAAAPRLVAGEWWRIRFSGDLYEPEVLRVVANVSEDGYVFGMPHEGWLKEAIVYHAPAFGDVGLDLSYAVHNEIFEPLRFPLVAGATWETVFAATPMTATVEQADESTATIRYDPPTSADPDPMAVALGLLMPAGDLGTMRLTYDARVHEIVRMESGIGSWEVVQHGYEFRGWVSVPTGAHTAIDYGTFGPDAANPLPTRTVHVDESFNRITLLHAVFALTPGVYRLTSTAPDGESFVTEVVGESGIHFGIYEVANPGGDWQQEDVAVGAGGTYTMGIAYQQYDILVPSGEQRPTHGHEVVR